MDHNDEILEVGRFKVFNSKIIYYQRECEVGGMVVEEAVGVVKLCVLVFAEVCADSYFLQVCLPGGRHTCICGPRP